MIRKIAFTLLFTCILVACQKEKQSPAESKTDGRDVTRLSAEKLLQDYKPGFILRTNGSSLAAIREVLAKNGAKETGYLPQLGMMFVKSPASVTVFTSQLKGLNVKIGLDFAIKSPAALLTKEPSGNNPPSTGSTNPYFSLQWSMDAIDAPQAWNAGYLGAGATVAVLDEGFWLNHPDLSANFLKSKARNFVNRDDLGAPFCGSFPECDPSDVGKKASDFSHATFVSGIIAAGNNSVGTIGVAPSAKILPVKVLSDYAGFGITSWIAQGIVYAADQGVNVINMSFGGLDIKGFGKGANEVQEDIRALNDAIQYANSKGVLVVCAAGNSAIDFDHPYIDEDGIFYGGSIISMPAGSPHALSISATSPYGFAYDQTTDLDIPSSYTNYGSSTINFAAPGGDFDHPGDLWFYDMVLSPGGGPPANYYYFAAGTSIAAPHVSGVAALIYGKYPGIKPAQVKSILAKSADDLGKRGNDPYFGGGRVNAGKAVQ
ncbi:hypothetical protein BH10BAC3_BH10BAC3_26420 [soil metagenome]